jgi:Carboxypeptidase regulatory-like domain
MWRLAVSLVFFASSCFAASRCPDPKMGQAAVGGDSISGVVLVHGEPFQFAVLGLYSTSGKLIRTATTNKKGRFTLPKLAPGKYSLNVPDWGSTSFQVSPKLDRDFPQKPNWFVTLTDNECVSAGVSVD